MTFKCSSDKKSHTSLTSNQKLEMIKFSEEDMLKGKIGCKLGLLLPTAKFFECKGKVLEGNKKCYSSDHLNAKEMKQHYC